MNSAYGDLINPIKRNKMSKRLSRNKVESRNRGRLNNKNFNNMSREESIEKLEYYQHLLSSFKDRKNTPSAVRKQAKINKSVNSAVYDRINPNISSKRPSVNLTPYTKSPLSSSKTSERKMKD